MLKNFFFSFRLQTTGMWATEAFFNGTFFFAPKIEIRNPNDYIVLFMVLCTGTVSDS